MHPDSGQISVNQSLWVDTQQHITLKPQKRKVGFLFQDYALFPNMTVERNLSFALSKGQNPAIVSELIEIMELQALRGEETTETIWRTATASCLGPCPGWPTSIAAIG